MAKKRTRTGFTSAQRIEVAFALHGVMTHAEVREVTGAALSYIEQIVRWPVYEVVAMRGRKKVWRRRNGEIEKTDKTTANQ